MRNFSDMICGNLKNAISKQSLMCQGREIYGASDDVMSLERIRWKYGSITLPPTLKHINKSRTVGTTVNSNCYACHKNLKGISNAQSNYLMLFNVKMPLCKESQKRV